MLAFPQAHADTATCSERAQHIHGPYGCFQNNVLQNIQAPGVHKRNNAHLWFSQMTLTGKNYVKDELIQLVLQMLRFSW